MYLVKRNKIFHLYYKDETGKLHCVTSKCSKKSDANNFAVKHLQQLKEGTKKKTILTYGEIFMGWKMIKYIYTLATLFDSKSKIKKH